MESWADVLVTLFVDHCVTCLWRKNVSNEECYEMEPMEFMECGLLVGLVNIVNQLVLMKIGICWHCAKIYIGGPCLEAYRYFFLVVPNQN